MKQYLLMALCALVFAPVFSQKVIVFERNLSDTDFTAAPLTYKVTKWTLKAKDGFILGEEGKKDGDFYFSFNTDSLDDDSDLFLNEQAAGGWFFGTSIWGIVNNDPRKGGRSTWSDFCLNPKTHSGYIVSRTTGERVRFQIAASPAAAAKVTFPAPTANRANQAIFVSLLDWNGSVLGSGELVKTNDPWIWQATVNGIVVKVRCASNDVNHPILNGANLYSVNDSQFSEGLYVKGEHKRGGMPCTEIKGEFFCPVISLHAEKP